MVEPEIVASPELKQIQPWCTRFAEGRKAAGASLKTVAAAAGVSFVAISQFELGKQSLSLDTFVKACAALRLRTDYVLNGTGPMFQGAAPAHMGSKRKRPAART